MDDMRDNFEEELDEETLLGEDDSLLADEDGDGFDDEEEDPLKMDGFQVEGDEEL